MNIELSKIAPFFLFFIILLAILLFFCFALTAFGVHIENRQPRMGIEEKEALSPALTNRMAKLIDTRDWLYNRNCSTSPENAHKDFANFLEHEFYTFARLVNRLETLKRRPKSHFVCNDLDQIIEDMRMHANKFKVSSNARQEILRLCRKVPEESLQNIENDFLKSAV